MIEKTYLFYDVETTGLNPCFDQILQFAAIRTDLDFNEISRDEICIKLNSDIIPHPMAILTHQQGIATMQQGISEYEGIKKIHQLINQPGTISLGYNTLGFDDEVLRYSFYRNLLTPYTHQYANQCARMDIFPITLLYYLFKPQTLKWPSKEGKVSLRLENINAENQLAHGQAHDAMVDVIATVELAKKLFQDKTMWQHCIGYFDKKQDLKRIDQLSNTLSTEDKHYPLAYVVNSKIGVKHQFIAPVLGLGTHQHYKNQTLWLRLDQQKLQQCQPDNFIDHSWVIKKKAGEQIIILPYHERYQTLIDSDRQSIIDNNLQWLASQAKTLHAIEQHYQQDTYPHVDGIDVDAALYQLPFANHQQQQAMRDFHQYPDNEKLFAASQIRCDYYFELAKRMLAKHYPDCLSPQDQADYQQYLKRIFSLEKQQPILDYRQQAKLNAVSTQQEIKQIKDKGKLTDLDLSLLDELEHYLLQQQSRQSVS